MPKPTPTPRIPTYLNVGYLFVAFAVQVYQFFLLPLWLLPQSLHWAWTLLLLAPFHNTLWALIHEAIHKILVPNAYWNDVLGRLMGISLGAAFHVLHFGHLMHHRYNRDWDSEVYHPQSSWYGKAPGYFGALFGGLYYLEFGVSLLVLCLPKGRLLRAIHQFSEERQLEGLKPLAEQYFFKRNRRRMIQWDTIGVFLFFGSSAYCFGHYWPIFLATLLLRGFMISFVDNVYHYGTALDNSEPAWELALPMWLRVFILNGNFHNTHHQYPTVPWVALPRCHAEKDIPFNKGYGSALWDQFRGPIDRHDFSR